MEGKLDEANSQENGKEKCESLELGRGRREGLGTSET